MGTLPQARSLVLFASAVGLLALACGSRDDDGPSAPAPVPPSAPPAVASPSPTPFPGGQPVWVPPGTFDCALGPGTKDAACGAPTSHFFDAVNTAVDKVVAEQRDLFPDRDITERVRDEGPFHIAVASILRAQGFCAGWNTIDLMVRNSNEFSEHYDLFDARGFFHQDPARRVRSTCTPADFPIAAADHIDSIRVGFYGIQCPSGVPKPPNSSGRLPVGCLGHVTATPKDKFFNDVDGRLHGPYVTWELTQRRPHVFMRDDPNTPFNKALRAESPGFFTLCATVQGHRGCLEGEVTGN